MLVYLNRTILSPLLPVIGEDLGLTGAQRGAIASTYFTFYVALQVPSGILGDRIGLKRVLVTMYAVIGVGMLAIGLLSYNYGLLLAATAVHGFGAGAYYSGSYGLTVTSVPKEQRGKSAAAVTAGMGVGLAAGLVLGGLLYEATGSWRAPYLIAAAPTALMAVAFMRVVKTSPQRPNERGGLRYYFGSRDLVPLSIAAFCLFYVQWVLLAWAPSFLYQERGVSLAQAGPFAAVITLPGIVGGQVFARVSDRWGRKRVLLALAPAGVAAILGLALLDSTAAALGSLAVYGFVGSFAINPVAVSWASDHMLASGKIGIGTGIGLFNTFVVGSSIVGPLLSGWVLDLTGSLQAGFLVAAGIAALGWALLFAPRETVRWE
jgi:MFS family permease